MKNKFVLWFDANGCSGLDVPQDATAEELAGHFEFLRKVAGAVRIFDECLKVVAEQVIVLPVARSKSANAKEATHGV